MSNQPADDEKIEAYLNGELSAADNAAFEAEQAANPELRASVQLHRELAETFGGQDPEYEAVRAVVATVGAAASRPGARSGALVRRLPRWAVGLAAAVLLAIGTFFLLRPKTEPHYDTLFAQYFQAYPADAFRGEEEDQASALVAAVVAYRAGDYATAARGFAAISPLPKEWTFYHALALLGSGEGQAAADLLLPLVEDPGFANLRQPMQWYLAMAYLQAGAKNEAREQPKTIAEAAEHYRREAAREILLLLE